MDYFRNSILNIKPNIVLESKSIITATDLALRGVGLTISSASILTRMRQTPVNLLKIDENLIYINFFIATKKILIFLLPCKN